MNLPAIIFDELKQYAIDIKNDEFIETFPYFIEYHTHCNMVQVHKVINNLLLKQCEKRSYTHNIRFQFDFNKLCEIISNIFENCDLNNKKPLYLEIRCLHKSYEILLSIFAINEFKSIPICTDPDELFIITKKQFSSEILKDLIKKCEYCYIGQIFISL
jgi:hypothetical protein